MDRSEILSRTHYGLDVFMHYYQGITGKLFCNTYRNDTRPSCKLYKRQDKYVMVDYGAREWNGDCFNLVSMIYQLDIKLQFPEILKHIIEDLNLEQCSQQSSTMEISLPEISSSREHIRFMASIYNNPYYLNYWKQYHISLDTLEKYKVYAIRKCQVYKEGGRRFTLAYKNDNPLFGYLLNGGLGIKLYLPYSTKFRFLYAGDVPKPYIFGSSQLPLTGDCLLITGGEKDVLSLSSHGFAAISFNSETFTIPSEVIQDYSQRFNKIRILYDVDETGLRSSEASVEHLKQQGFSHVERIILPLSGSKTDKDISDFFKNGHSVNEFSSLI